MTTLGMEYLKTQENKRHNLASEQETHRANVASEKQNLLSLDETMRANRANEALKHAQNVETNRANTAKESLEQSKQTETHRHNKMSERADMAKAFGNATNPLLAASGAAMVDSYDIINTFRPATMLTNTIKGLTFEDVQKGVEASTNYLSDATKDVVDTGKLWWDQGPGKLLSDVAKGFETLVGDRTFYLYN